MSFFNPLPLLPALIPRRPYRDDRTYVRPLDEEELQEFLEDTSDIQGTLDLWNKHSGLPGILEGTVREEDRKTLQTHAPRRLVDIYFDRKIGFWRYVQSGRRIYPSRVRSGVMRISKFSERSMRDLTRQLVNGEISREAWYRSMRQMMKDEYRAAYLASIGGLDNYDRSEVSKFGWRMRPHYRWLNNFLEELNSGKQPLNGFAVNRAGMYGRAGNSIYWNNMANVAEENGFDEYLRILGENDNHCHDTESTNGCIELAALGWQPMSRFVPIGGATCLSNDLCTLKFRRSA